MLPERTEHRWVFVPKWSKFFEIGIVYVPQQVSDVSLLIMRRVVDSFILSSWTLKKEETSCVPTHFGMIITPIQIYWFGYIVHCYVSWMVSKRLIQSGCCLASKRGCCSLNLEICAFLSSLLLHEILKGQESTLQTTVKALRLEYLTWYRWKFLILIFFISCLASSMLKKNMFLLLVPFLSNCFYFDISIFR